MNFVEQVVSFARRLDEEEDELESLPLLKLGSGTLELCN